MITPTKKQNILERNRKIDRAIHISRLMDSEDFKYLMDELDEQENDYRFQDILGIKDDALSDQKGIVGGILLIKKMFEDMKILSEKPRRDPETGEFEVLNKKK